MKKLSFALCIGFAAFLSACSSDSNSDSDSSGGATNTGTANSGSTNNGAGNGAGSAGSGTTSSGNGTSGNANNTAGGTTTTQPPANNTGGNTGSENNGSANNVSLLDAGLSHAGTPIPKSATVANDPEILRTGRDRVAGLANSPAVIFEVVSNQGASARGNEYCDALFAQWNSCNIVNLHIKDSNGDLNDRDWKLYFHSTRRILQFSSDEFDLMHVNGDLHYITPNDQFNGFGGDVKSVKMTSEYNYLVETDFQPRYWIARGGNATLIANTDEETNESAYAMDITGGNRLEFSGETNVIAAAGNRFDRNADLISRTSTIAASAVKSRIVPKPDSVTVGAGQLDIANGFSFANLALPAASISALRARQEQFMNPAAGVPLQSSIGGVPANSYTLSVTTTGITINASDESMLFYAAQSLLGLVQPGDVTIPVVEISDSPRFGFRGMHVDVARNFHSVTSMKKLIDQMGAYKLNKLHLHLSDDEGWRLEIPSLPELTNVGGTRKFSVDDNGLVTETGSLMPAMGSGPNNNNQGSGFYSRAEFIDLLQYANARFIEVIPEFDMPAHARAAVVAMRARAANLGNARDINVRIDDPDDESVYLTVQNYNDSFINPCVPGTTNFMRSVVNDVKGMYTAAGLPLNIWHMGGDEAVNILLGFGLANKDPSKHDQPWAKSPVCNALINDNPAVSSREELEPFFVKQMSQIVADAGIPAFYAYQDIYSSISANELSTNDAGVDFWVPLSGNNATSAIESANDFNARGFQTVLGNPDFLYFDFPYEVDPKERGYYWATRKLATEKLFSFAPENLAQNAETSVARYGEDWSASNAGSYTGYSGMQGYLWSETVRTPEHFDYMLFPRVLALAERSWHKASWELNYVDGEAYSASSGKVNTADLNTDYATFALALAQKEFPKLDAAGVGYRIPPPGARVQGGQLMMNSNFPGMPLEYSSDGSSWQTWNAGSPPAGASFIRSSSIDRSRTGRVTPVE